MIFLTKHVDINQKSAESNYIPMKESVSTWVGEINQQLMQMNAAANRWLEYIALNIAST